MTTPREQARLARKGMPRRRSEWASSLRLLGDLRDLGWQRSLRTHVPVDAAGEPLPWMNYAAIEVLESILDPSTRVFEYGSGYSTAWLSRRCRSVDAVEHDPEWWERVRSLEHGRLSVRCVACVGDALDAPADDAYVNAPEAAGGGVPFDIVIVDGMARRSCLTAADGYLGPGGVVVLDDADRPELAESRRAMRERGYLEVPIRGPKPAYGHFTTTSFFISR